VSLDGAPSHDRWLEVERLYHAARERGPAERAAFLRAECADPELFREVETLLEHDTAAGNFLETPAVEESLVSITASHGPLPAGHRIGGYEVLELIGSGGMGDVYRARDLRLEREVALKVVDRATTLDDAYVRRFEDEARAASGLVHPGIVTIYGVGEDADTAFIAMELVRGSTLRKRMDDGRLATGEAVAWAVDLADALAAAHEAGVVHRDLKPDNVMVTADGRVKILDFGIAKRTGSVEAERTRVEGTAGYMSPEQAAGLVVDHTTDQFSFGAVCYEMLTGRRAFRGDTSTAIIEAVRTVEPAPITRLDPDVPAGIRAAVERCLEKAPAGRYPSTRDLAGQLRAAASDWQHEEAVRRMRRQTLWLAGAAAGVAVAGWSTWRFWPAGPSPRSLAVLPFDNTDGDPGVDYLCEGLSEGVLRLLYFLPGIDVRPRSAMSQLIGVSAGPTEAGRRLAVEAVLAGAVALRGDRIEVSARLVDVATGADLWAEDYNRPAADMIRMEHDLARAIVADGIRRPLDDRTARRLDRPATEHAEAFDLYLRALYLHRLEGESNYLRARALLQHAVALDPAFALAQVSLASTFTVMTIDGFERPVDAWPESNRAVRQALEVDGALAEAHSEQSSAWFFFDHDWQGAESAWKRAVDARSSPTLPDLLSGAAVKLWALGRMDEALTMARRARGLDPLTPRFARQEADLLIHAGRPAEAIATYEELLQADAADAASLFGLADACRARGDIRRAVAVRRHAHEVIGWIDAPATADDGDLAYRALERAEAERELADLARRVEAGFYVSPLDAARARARLGDRDGAIRDLDAAFEERSPGLVFLRVDRAWQELHEDLRFQAAVELVGLPSAAVS